MRWTQEQLDNHLRKGRGGALASAPRATKRVTPVTEPKKRTKHGNIRIEVDGEKFDSKLEARYYKQLCIEWRAGDVMWFKRQVPFELEGGVVYIADFIVVRGNKVTAEVHSFTVEDTKGNTTRESLNKMKQVLARYGLKVKIIRDADVMRGITV